MPRRCSSSEPKSPRLCQRWPPKNYRDGNDDPSPEATGVLYKYKTGSSVQIFHNHKVRFSIEYLCDYLIGGDFFRLPHFLRHDLALVFLPVPRLVLIKPESPLAVQRVLRHHMFQLNL